MPEIKILRGGYRRQEQTQVPESILQQQEDVNVPFDEESIEEPLVAHGLAPVSREDVIKQQRQLREQYKAPQQYQPTEGADIGLGGRIGLSALRGAEVPGQLLNQIAQLIGEEGFIKKPLSQDIQESLGVSEEQLQPRGTIEKYAQRVAGQAPTAALFGPAALGRTALSAVPAVLSGEAGAPEWLQDLIQLGSDITIGATTGSIKDPRVIPAQKNAYNVAKSLVSDAERPGATKVIEALTQVGKNLETESDPTIITKVNQAINTVKQNFRGIFNASGKALKPGLNPKKALELRRKLYKFGAKNTNIRQDYIEPLTKGINDFFSEYAANNPAFFSALKRGDKLTAAKNMQSYLANNITKIPYLKKIPIFNTAVNKLLGSGEKIIKRAIFNPEAQSLYLDLVKSVGEGNSGLIAKNLQDFTQYLNEEEPVAKSKKSSVPKGFKIIRGGRI